MIKPTYLRFEESALKDVDIWYLIRKKDDLMIGSLEKIRIGRWMSWVLFLEKRCYLSASCQDEVREKTRELNARR